MKKILLLIFLLLPINVYAEWEMFCDNYEVSYINDLGQFEKIECYDTFTKANEKIKENQDYVVRNKNSLSPMKIISMNNGIAYSYPGRNNSSTLKIYQHPSDRSVDYKSTYISSHYEMYYKQTERIVKNGGLGMIEVEINGFEGYADLEFTDLVPLKFFEKGLTVELGGCDTEESFKLIPKLSYYQVIKNGNYNDLIFTYFRGYSSDGKNPLTATLYLCPGFDFMEFNTNYYSSDGVTFYKDFKKENFLGQQYSYYQFLPLRTKSKINSDVYNNIVSNYSNSIIKGKGDIFKDAEKYGVNSTILFAMAIHESAYGTSNIALNKNNLFGWNAVDSTPGESSSYFDSVDKCIYEQASINLRGYSDLKDWRFFGNHLGNKGSGLNVQYASDPYWGMKISGIMYRMDKIANDFNGNLTEFNDTKIASIESFNTSLYKNDEVVATTKYGAYYQKNFIIPVIDTDKGLVQSPNAIVDNHIYTHVSDGSLNSAIEYNFENSIVYINLDDIKPLNYNLSVEHKDGQVYLSNMKFDDTGLRIEGYSIVSGKQFNENVKHSVVLKDYENNEIEILANTIQEDFQNGDGNVYKNCKFSVVVPYNKLTDCVIWIKSTDGKYITENLLKNSNPKYSNLNTKNDNLFVVKTNQNKNYRFEISVLNNFEYEVNKPSARESLLSFDSIKYNEGVLSVKGQSYIYYTDSVQPNKIELFLVGDNNLYSVESETKECPISYKDILGVEEDLSYICFDIEKDLSEYNPDNYSMFIKTYNEEYKDTVELTNRNNRTIDLKTDIVRNRIVLEK